MPYGSVNELPDNVEKDKRRTDESREEVAFKVAWSAVKNVYEKTGDGQWQKKDKD